MHTCKPGLLHLRGCLVVPAGGATLVFDVEMVSIKEGGGGFRSGQYAGDDAYGMAYGDHDHHDHDGYDHHHHHHDGHDHGHFSYE